MSLDLRGNWWPEAARSEQIRPGAPSERLGLENHEMSLLS